MSVHYDPFKEEIAHTILKIVAKKAETTVDFDTVYNSLALPPEFSLGQAAFPCFILAKSLRMSPAMLAKDIATEINAEAKKTIDSAQALGPYINFHCNFSELLNLEFAKNIDKNTLAPKNIEHIIVEYSQPNTHKTMHVGHLRCLVLGDALCNILEYVGHKVVRATYPGDIGTHVAKIIWYLTHPKKALPTANKAQWLGEMYAKADTALKSLKDTPEEQDVKKNIAQILKEIAEENGPYYELWKETREWSLDYLKSIYTWLDCKFDRWYFESEFEQPSKEFVIQKYKEGFLVKDQGAIGIDLSDYNLGFAMYLKSDGNGLYITKDLLLLNEKFSDPTITRSIYIVDARQKRHFEQLFKTAELMGYKQASSSYHLSYETVNTESGEPFSSRALKGMEISELKNQMEEKIKTDYLARYIGNWSETEIEQVSKDVCIGALKYGLLNTDNNTQIRFSLSEWLKLDGDTGPYLQYVHARCSSILEKAKNDAKLSNIQNPLITEELEKKLLFFNHRFPEVCLQAAQHYKPSIIANYLYDLAKLFNRFYEACPILKSEAEVKATRLLLVQLTKNTIHQGLKLLGIKSPAKM